MTFTKLSAYFQREVTRIARVDKHTATNDNSLDLDPFTDDRKLALVKVIPNQILFSFSSNKERRTACTLGQSGSPRIIVEKELTALRLERTSPPAKSERVLRS